MITIFVISTVTFFLKKELRNTQMNPEDNSIAMIVRKECNELLLSLDGDTATVSRIVSNFITSTPIIFEKIHACVVLKKWAEAAALVHHVKTRYGYLGLTSLFDELTRWERQLTDAMPADHMLYVNRFKKLNFEISEELKETIFYKTEKEIDSEPPLLGKKVLIAEDDEINAKVFELFVAETGATVTVVNNGSDALQLALEQNPDIIFVDVHMTLYSGIEAIRELRLQGITCPILSLSASTRLQEKETSIDAGANDFLSKPATRKVVVDALMKYLGK